MPRYRARIYWTKVVAYAMQVHEYEAEIKET